MIDLVITGGQTGADQAGWRAAKAAGIPTGGWMPKGFLTEDGPRPEFARMYGAREHPSPAYPPRTESNIGMADMTFLFGNAGSPGGKLVHRITRELDQHLVLTVESPGAYPPAWAVESILRWTGIRAINVAGNRESSAPGIGEWVERYLAEVFRLLTARSRSGPGARGRSDQGAPVRPNDLNDLRGGDTDRFPPNALGIREMGRRGLRSSGLRPNPLGRKGDDRRG